MIIRCDCGKLTTIRPFRASGELRTACFHGQRSNQQFVKPEEKPEPEPIKKPKARKRSVVKVTKISRTFGKRL